MPLECHYCGGDVEGIETEDMQVFGSCMTEDCSYEYIQTCNKTIEIYEGVETEKK